MLTNPKARLSMIFGTVFKFHWQPNRHTWVALAAGIVVILLSLAVIPFKGTPYGYVIFTLSRDLLMVVGMGVVLPINYTHWIEKRPLSDLGLTAKNWSVMLLVSIAIGTMLAWNFYSKATTMPKLEGAWPAILYIMVTGIFEMVFFYGFLQNHFDRAFGTIPGIVLAAVLYSFHHAGFQPEFLSLFFVGIFFMSIFRAAGSLWVLYPFAWGVGALWDVLVDFGADVNLFRWENGIGMLVLIFLFAVWFRGKYKHQDS